MPLSENSVAGIVDSVLDSYQSLVGIAPRDGSVLPTPKTISGLVFQIRDLLFPGYFDGKSIQDIRSETQARIRSIATMLNQEIGKAIALGDPSSQNSEAIVGEFFTQVPRLREQLWRDIRALDAGDPAAKSELEILLAYPGFTAIMMYRIAHHFYNAEIPVMPRMITELAHTLTGIDIHPGATIGDYFCIDHGTGIVIGETTVIGRNVKLYQGVTLGALSVVKTDSRNKRHPTIEDEVTIYAHATILGGDTVIGHHSVIGGNVWITESARPYSKISLTSEGHQVIRSSKTDAL